MKYPVTRAELAGFYGVSRKTFYNWLKKKNIKISEGYLCPNDLNLIFDALGKPEGLKRSEKG